MLAWVKVVKRSVEVHLFEPLNKQNPKKKKYTFEFEFYKSWCQFVYIIKDDS